MAIWFREIFKCIKNSSPKRGFFIIILLLLFYTCTRKYVRNNKFDHLIFSQRWLPTACIEYVEKSTSNNDKLILFGSGNPHFCTLPNNYKTWSIHGLWPTQGSSMGPFFCNRSLSFDIYQIKPIEKDMELYWPNIEGGEDVASLWKHEWEKHGTCAVQLESLNNEMKYFNTSLTFYEAHNMNVIFSRNNITPSKNISISDLFYTIKNKIGKVPQIHCIHEVKTKQPFLSEIRLCYNNYLELIDCKDMHNSELNNWSFISGITNCPSDRNIIFPDSINPILENESANKNSEKLDYLNKLYDSLLIIRFLQWVSI